MQRGLKAGREAAPRGSGAEGLPYPRPRREIPPRWQSASRLCSPAAGTAPGLQSPNASKGQWSLLFSFILSDDGRGLGSDAILQTIQKSRACLFLLVWAEILLRCRASRLTCSEGAVPSSTSGPSPLPTSVREHVQAEGGPGAVHNFTGCSFQSKIHFKAQHGFWCRVTLLQQSRQKMTRVLSL